MTAPDGQKHHGIYRPNPPGVGPGKGDPVEQRVAEFSYQNDALADLIVQLWSADPNGLTDTTKDEPTRMGAARTELDKRGIHLSKPLVIKETEYYDGYTLTDKDGVVFVLPDKNRVTSAAGTPLLEAAKLLMACTPNGI
jgi:hypothetical protein